MGAYGGSKGVLTNLVRCNKRLHRIFRFETIIQDQQSGTYNIVVSAF